MPSFLSETLYLTIAVPQSVGAALGLVALAGAWSEWGRGRSPLTREETDARAGVEVRPMVVSRGSGLDGAGGSLVGMGARSVAPKSSGNLCTEVACVPRVNRRLVTKSKTAALAVRGNVFILLFWRFLFWTSF